MGSESHSHRFPRQANGYGCRGHRFSAYSTRSKKEPLRKKGCGVGTLSPYKASMTNLREESEKEEDEKNFLPSHSPGSLMD